MKTAESHNSTLCGKIEITRLPYNKNIVTKKIALYGKHGDGKFALIDDEDFEELNKYRWNLSNFGYVVRMTKVDGKAKLVRMHRVINKTPDRIITDHINGIKVDNRKENLRSCTQQQNTRNRAVASHNRLGIKGVSIHLIKSRGKTRAYFRAGICVGGKRIDLGHYSVAEDATKAYNEAAVKLFGEFENHTRILHR